MYFCFSDKIIRRIWLEEDGQMNDYRICMDDWCATILDTETPPPSLSHDGLHDAKEGFRICMEKTGGRPSLLMDLTMTDKFSE